MRLEYHASARADIVEAVRRYRDERWSLGKEFLDELDAGIAAILATPERWAVHRRRMRRYILRRFPYGIFYEFHSPDLVRILIVKHHSRRPGYGMRRS